MKFVVGWANHIFSLYAIEKKCYNTSNILLGLVAAVDLKRATLP